MKRYLGRFRVENGDPKSFVVQVEQDGEHHYLSPEPSLRLANHSPTGFSWGYEGSGPAQLALAILYDFTGDADYALANYQDFKREQIARMSMTSAWDMEGEALQKWIDTRATWEKLRGMGFAELRIEPGNVVLCDDCNEDFTDSDRSGGIQFMSRAICPDCAPKWELDARKHGETHHIKARCPEGKSFADWVREDLR